MPLFQFELITPEKMLLGKAVAMVTVPGGEGDYGVLAGHAPMITTVRSGVIEVYERDDATVSDRIFVADGFAEVTGERCAVLAGEAVPVKDLDRARLEADAKAIGEDLADPSFAGREAAEARLAVVQAKLRAVA
jgi:F-type H+-transporting ATPase subunit epsilon